MSKLGENIKTLRNAYGETLADLAGVLHCAKSTVSQYESGARTPDIHMLQVIASHYGYPLDQLIRADFSSLDFKGDTLSWQDAAEKLDVFFPLIPTERVPDDKLFARGNAILSEILSSIKTKSSAVNKRQFEGAFDAYAESVDTTGTVESAANMIGLLILWWSLIPDGYTDRIGDALQKSDVSPVRFLKMKSALDREVPKSEVLADRENKRQFMLGAIEGINECLKLVKSSAEYAPLADYFIALRYLICMVDTEHSRDMNIAIGKELMLTYTSLGNPYASKFVEVALSR